MRISSLYSFPTQGHAFLFAHVLGKIWVESTYRKTKFYASLKTFRMFMVFVRRATKMQQWIIIREVFMQLLFLILEPFSVT